MENKKISWLTWLALLFAAAAFIISFMFIGQAKDTSGEFEDAYNATLAQLNEIVEGYSEIAEEYNLIVEDYNLVTGNFSRLIEEYNLIVEDYWEWRNEN